MANYATAVLAKGQAVVTAKNQSPEQRRKIPTVFELAIQNQEYSIPNAQELRVSPLRPVEINYFTNVAPGNGTSKAYNHTGTYGDSGKVELVYVTHVEPFSLPRKLAVNSIMQYQAIFENLYEQKWKNLRKRHDDSAIAFLYANRVQLTAAVMNPQLASAGLGSGGVVGSYNEANAAIEINQTYQKQFIQYAKAGMASRLFGGELDVIADLQLAAAFDYAAQQGAGNAANTQFQYAGTNIAVTQDVIASNYALGSALILPKGLFSGLNWNEQLNVKGLSEDIGGPIGMLGTAKDPLGSGAIADISMYTQRSDTSANTSGGSTQDVVDQWELTLTVAYALPPLSTSNESVVHLFGQGQ
jgi:hypothetical protein